MIEFRMQTLLQRCVFATLLAAVALGPLAGQTTEELIEELHPKAERGDTQAQHELGDKYWMKGEYSEAAKWFRLASEKGHLFAQYELGRLYLKGAGVPQDYTEAAKWFRKAARSRLFYRWGVESARYQLGRMYHEGKGVPQDYAKAAEWYRKAAKGDHLIAFLWMAHMYDKGLGAPQDYVKAAKYYRSAAMMGSYGSSIGQYRLGRMHYNGEGVSRDYTKAAKWYRLSAERQLALAQYELGRMYLKGEGVSQDDVQAHMWLCLAVSPPRGKAYYREDRTGHPPHELTPNQIAEVHYLKEQLAGRMPPEQIAEAQHLVREWQPPTHEGLIRQRLALKFPDHYGSGEAGDDQGKPAR